METFMSCFIVVSILYSRRRCGVFEHSVNVCRIKTTIKHDINVSITLFYKGRYILNTISRQPLSMKTGNRMSSQG
jgi:hypothetical protein